MSAAVATAPGTAARPDFFERLVAWQRQHGRHGLPWQGTRDPYRVWLSEIMLQQTQVSTVLDYYPRFLQRFPDLKALAQAAQDEVLALWSGLGYYSRARHLHRCAQVVVDQHGGRFPSSLSGLQALPGIGRSTAAAIAAFCFGERVSILDGNVRRVLSRLLAFEGDLAEVAQERRLWDLAQGLLPPVASHDDMSAYTQGLMDLGAGLCARSRPRCEACPVAALCLARSQERVADFPVRTRRLKRQTFEWWWLVWRRPDGAIWLQQRPGTGIWAGLHCLPTFASREEGLAWLAQHQAGTGGWQELDTVRHVLTHRDLVLRPLRLDRPGSTCEAMEATETASGRSGLWVRTHADLLTVGVPAPLRTLLLGLLPDT